MIGKLQRVPLRTVWKHEALDFTKWLQENFEILNEVLDISLTNVEREQAAGDFSVDLVAEDESGHPVIIENQLEKSDHSHLGQLVTYLTTYNAQTAIWIVAEPRPEHVNAISWLNESTAASFYLFKVEAVQIVSQEGDQSSPPAPLLTLIVGPSETSREAGEKKKELAEREVLRHQFWTELLQKAKAQTGLHSNISPSTDTWISAGAGRSGLGFNYVVGQHDARVELYIDVGDFERNKSIFDHLLAQRGAIESDFGGDLDWERLEGKRASRISKRIKAGGYRDENWEQTQKLMVDAMIRLEHALRPHLKNLPH